MSHISSIAAALMLVSASIFAQPNGEIKGDAWVHTNDSLAASAAQADVCIPSAATGGATYCGKFKDIPKLSGSQVPVIVFLHGSSGLGLKAIGEWQQWLAGLGYASIAPAIAALKNQRWVDPRRLILAGTSEGAVPVARYPGTEFTARILYAWSCEANYFVTEPRNSFEASKPVLNVISAQDPFFSKTNTWLGNAQAQGHCAAALKDNTQASVLLVPNAPHTLLNLPATRSATAGFLSQFTKP